LVSLGYLDHQIVLVCDFLNIALSASNFLISSDDVEFFTQSVFAGIGQQGVIEVPTARGEMNSSSSCLS
jgi:hypothetical protein